MTNLRGSLLIQAFLKGKICVSVQESDLYEAVIKLVSSVEQKNYTDHKE